MITNHAELMDAIEELIRLLVNERVDGKPHKFDDDIRECKANIAEFLRTQSAAKGVYSGDK